MHALEMRKGQEDGSDKRTPQGRCKVCHTNPAFWCKGCSNDEETVKPFIICGRDGTKMKKWWEMHIHGRF